MLGLLFPLISMGAADLNRMLLQKISEMLSLIINWMPEMSAILLPPADKVEAIYHAHAD